MTQPSSSSDDIQLTAEEANKFNAAFKSEEFRKLMAEYVDALNDPRSKEELGTYISHLEAKKELPPGKSLIRPNAGFVVKCYITENQHPSKQKKKVFLNIVHSEKIAQPSSQKSSSSEATRSKWSVPNAIGPIRMEHDKSKNLVPTIDCCFHPQTLLLAYSHSEFLDMVIDIAKSAVVDVYSKTSKEGITIDSYVILKNVQYKNGTPSALLVGNRDELPSTKKEKSDIPIPKKLDTATDVTETEETTDATTDKTNDKEIADVSTETITPKYKIVERGMLELTNNDNSNRRPKQLIVHVFLDKIASAAEIDLHVGKDDVKVESNALSSVKYSLEVELPYPIGSKNGKATFDKAKRSLILTLPLLPK